jgi:hypothetical protein
VLLTLTTGAVDVTSFLALGNVFSSVVTGDMVLLGAAAGTGRPELAVHSGVALAGYLAGVMGGAPLAGRRHHATGTWPPSVTVTLAGNWQAPTRPVPVSLRWWRCSRLRWACRRPRSGAWARCQPPT